MQVGNADREAQCRLGRGRGQSQKSQGGKARRAALDRGGQRGGRGGGAATLGSSPSLSAQPAPQRPRRDRDCRVRPGVCLTMLLLSREGRHLPCTSGHVPRSHAALCSLDPGHQRPVRCPEPLELRALPGFSTLLPRGAWLVCSQTCPFPWGLPSRHQCLRLLPLLQRRLALHQSPCGRSLLLSECDDHSSPRHTRSYTHVCM